MVSSEASVSDFSGFAGDERITVTEAAVLARIAEGKAEDELWKSFVKEAEERAAEDLEAYRSRLLRRARSYLAVLWLAYCGVLGLCAAVGIYLFFTDVALFLKVFPWVLLVSLLPTGFRLLPSLHEPRPESDGYVLKRDEAPEFWAMVEDVARRLNVPMPDQVEISSNLNAMARVSYVGLWPFQRRESLISMGLWTLAALSRDEARSVIAHEFGHLRSSPYFVNRLGRLIAMIDAFRNVIIDYNTLARISTPVIDRVLMRLCAASYAVQRADEFAADATSVEVAGRGTMADALVRLSVASNETGNYFDRLRDRMVEGAQLPDDVISELCRRLPYATRQRDAVKSVRRELAEETRADDTHPACRARIEAQGIQPRTPSVLTEPAISLLGSTAEELLKRFDQEYVADTQEEWTEVVEFAARRREELLRLDDLADSQVLALEQAIGRAHLSAQVGRREDARKRYEDLLSLYGEQARAHFAMGQFMYQKDEPACVEHFEKCVELDETSLPACAEYLSDYFVSADDLERAEHWRKRGLSVVDRYDEWRHEAHWLRATSSFLVREHDRELAERLRPILEPGTFIREAFVLSKRVPEWFGGPTTWVVVRDSSLAVARDQSEIYGRVVEAIHATDACILHEFEFSVWVIEKGEEDLLETLRTVDRAKLFNKDDPSHVKTSRRFKVFGRA